MQINRRDFLAGTGAALAASALPPAAVVAVEASTAAPINLTAWAVGTEGEWDYQHIIADTREQAIREWAVGQSSGKCECEDGEDRECEFCCAVDRADASRKPMWDGKQQITSGDWLRADMGTYCSRCSYETYAETGGYAVGDEAVCEDCMKLADWDIADPDRADEIREEMIEDGETPPPRMCHGSEGVLK